MKALLANFFDTVSAVGGSFRSSLTRQVLSLRLHLNCDLCLRADLSGDRVAEHKDGPDG